MLSPKSQSDYPSKPNPEESTTQTTSDSSFDLIDSMACLLALM
jgi:hypothetical protein